MSIESAPLPPSLPAYDKPREKLVAELPQGLQPSPKPHGIFNKVVGRMLKMKTTKMSGKTTQKPFKGKKKKTIVK